MSLAVAGAFALGIAEPTALAQCRVLCGDGGGNEPAQPAPPPPPAPVPVPDSTPAPLAVGFNDIASLHPDFSEARFADMLVDAGATLHRWTASWANYETAPGEFHPGYLDHLANTYDGERDRGIGAVIQLFGAPKWTMDPTARTPGGGRPCKTAAEPCLVPPNVRSRTIKAAWRDWVKTMAGRFPDAAAFEIWNEPNLLWSWQIKQDPELYALMVGAAKDALRDIGSDIPVITGGLSNTKQNSTSYTSLESMLKAVYYYAGSDGFDGIGYHAYPCATDSDPAKLLQTTLERVRTYKNSKDDLDRTLWLTETGASTGGSPSEGCGLGFTEDTQGPALAKVVAWGRATQAQGGDLHALIVNSLINAEARPDIDVPNDDSHDEYGIVAWAYGSAGEIVTRNKPGYDVVRCAFLETC